MGNVKLMVISVHARKTIQDQNVISVLQATIDSLIVQNVIVISKDLLLMDVKL